MEKKLPSLNQSFTFKPHASNKAKSARVNQSFNVEQTQTEPFQPLKNKRVTELRDVAYQYIGRAVKYGKRMYNLFGRIEANKNELLDKNKIFNTKNYTGKLKNIQHEIEKMENMVMKEKSNVNAEKGKVANLTEEINTIRKEIKVILDTISSMKSDFRKIVS